MEWQSKRSPGIAFANGGSGDVALCGAFTAPPAIPPAAAERVCFAAALASRSQLETLLRALQLHPDVRCLILCGAQAEPAGESLLALWRDGLEEGGRVPGSRGVLSADLDANAVDRLRQDVRVLDWRQLPVAEITKGIAGLPVLARSREALESSPPPPRERLRFPSRGTTFPLFSASVGDAWLQLLNLVLRIGTERRRPDGARIAEALNAVVTIEPEAADDELPAFCDFNREDFERYCRHFAACTSPAAARSGDRDAERATDPLEAVCARLRDGGHADAAFLVGRGESGRRWNEAIPLPAAFSVLDGKLFASFVLRSADVRADWPLVAAALVRVQRSLAERAGLAAGTSVFVVQCAYLDDRDWNHAWALLAEHFRRPLPLQIDPAGIFLFGNDGGQARAMLLDHDASTIFWEEAFDDPEDLSWYIVDVMPWLLPQHVRYVGQECAALMHAIRTDDCYVQG